jgi:hypothetical protein
MNRFRKLALSAGVAAIALSAPACTATSASATAWPSAFVLPDHHLTPGAIRHDPISMICPHVSPKLEALRPGAAVKAQVYAEYRIWHHYYGQYEVDHLVPVELDGADTKANLWPEPELHNPKDKLENKLHRLVCSGQLSLAAAQRAIETDWRTAYVRYVGKP